jgi:hypothetical protein
MVHLDGQSEARRQLGPNRRSVINCFVYQRLIQRVDFKYWYLLTGIVPRERN